MVNWKWDNEPFPDIETYDFVEDWEEGKWSCCPRITELFGNIIFENLMMVDISTKKDDAVISHNTTELKWENINDNPKKMQTSGNRSRQSYHRSRNKYIKVGSFNIEGIAPPTNSDGKPHHGEYSSRLLEAIEYAKGQHLDCLALQETYGKVDKAYKTAHGWRLYEAGDGLQHGERSGVAILVPPHRVQYLKDVLVQSHRLMAAILE